MQYVGVDVPHEPETNIVIDNIIHVFYLASRARRYIGGMAVSPLPLSVADINDVLMAHHCYTDRETLDACVFAIDDEWLQENQKAVE